VTAFRVVQQGALKAGISAQGLPDWDRLEEAWSAKTGILTVDAACPLARVAHQWGFMFGLVDPRVDVLAEDNGDIAPSGLDSDAAFSSPVRTTLRTLSRRLRPTGPPDRKYISEISFSGTIFTRGVTFCAAMLLETV